MLQEWRTSAQTARDRGEHMYCWAALEYSITFFPGRQEAPQRAPSEWAQARGPRHRRDVSGMAMTD